MSLEADSRNRQHAALAVVSDLLDSQEPQHYQPRNGKIERWRFRPSFVQLQLLGQGGTDVTLSVAGRALAAHTFWCVANLFVHPGRAGAIHLHTSSRTLQSMPGRVANCRYIAQRAHEVEFRFDTPIDVGLIIPDAVERRVLIADDEDLSRALTERLLRKLNADVDSVASGATAVEKARTGAYDVIILDIEMPEMDGFATLAALRESGAAAPVAALTAHNSAEMEKRCRDAGFDTMMPKPVTVDKLRVLLGLAGRQALISTMANDPDLVDLIRGFVSGLPDRVSSIHKALTAGNREDLLARLATLRSDATGLGYAPLGDSTKELDDALTSGDTERQQAAMRRLLQLCARVRDIPADQPAKVPAAAH